MAEQEKYLTIRTCNDLMKEFEMLDFKDNSSKLNFQGIPQNKDIYNITAPFETEKGRYLAGRVEPRDSEYSQVVFFKQNGDSWMADESLPSLNLQDPFVTKIAGEIVLGGVEVFDDEKAPGQLNYRTIFYKGSSLEHLACFAQGPDRMKDIRLHELEDGRILVFTRPQGEIGGRGKIGWMLIDSLNELNPKTICKASLLRGQFIDEEWGGANEIHRLDGSKVGVLAHIARFDEQGNRHYHATAFTFDWQTGEYSPMKLIAVRSNFQEGAWKRPDLQDVIFSGGLCRKKDGTAELYCGVSDAEGHCITIPDPFI